MEMEFKDNSRRRTLVLVVGVLLALGAGAAAFMLSSQGQDEPEEVFPTRQVVVAGDFIPARENIGLDMVTLREVQLDDSNAGAFTDVNEVAGSVAAICFDARDRAPARMQPDNSHHLFLCFSPNRKRA